MARSIGIDLGTTFSAAAIKKREPVVIAKGMEPLMRSCVGILNGKQEVGGAAFDGLKHDPKNVILSVKRLMGRDFADPEVQKLVQAGRFDYTVKASATGTGENLVVVLDGKEYSPEQVSAQILKEIKRYAGEAEGSIDSAVITVPAYFNDKQKHATRIAANLAGLKVQRLLPEPTAAAIAHGLEEMQADEAKNVLVYDFGGGTFDVSVLAIADGQFIEMGKGGDMLLGGDDIDDLLKDYVVNQVETEYGLDDLGVLVNRMDERLRHRFQGVLREKIEEAKIKLSGANAALVEIFGLLRDEDGDLLDIDVEIDRPTFNRLIGPKIERTIELCHQTLASVNFEPDLIDTYLLVGGSASIPLVFERMQAVFGTDKVRRHNQPMLAVTQGAATFAHRLAETVECIHCGVDIPQEVDPCPECNREQDQKIEVIHTTAHEYVIELKDDPQHVLVRGNDILPVTSAHTFRTVADNQHLIEVKIYNSVNKKPEKVLTAFVGLEQDFPAGTEVVVVFTVDENNEIHLNVDRIGDSGNGFSITEGRGKDDHALLEQVEVEIEKVNRLNLDTDKVTRFESDIKAVLGKINGVIDPKTESVNQEQFDNCQREIGAIEQRAGQRLLSLENVENRYHWIENVYGEILSSELKYELADLWEEANQHRSDPEKLDQIDRQMWQLAMQDSLVGSLIMIEIAARRIESTDPSKAEFLLARHRRIIQAHQSRRYEEAAEILSVTLPETSAILGEERESMGQRPIETRLQR